MKIPLLGERGRDNRVVSRREKQSNGTFAKKREDDQHSSSLVFPVGIHVLYTVFHTVVTVSWSLRKTKDDDIHSTV